tara:strand:- start:790 stop:2043 length:1254 start_codon:yes stop_codon:yes gene_type:complete
MNYGFNGLNKNLNSRQSNNTNLFNNLENKDTIISVRVKGIILDETHPRFKELGEWNALGVIEYEIVNSPTNPGNFYSTASPLNPNSKTFPLINEIVYVISLPSTEIGVSNSKVKKYYLNTINLWNHPHHNGYPLNSNSLPPTQKKDYEQTQAGSVRRVTDQSTEIFLGNTFKERSNIHPILPFEGDIIHEGRWGNSIRLGSTVKNTNNNWSLTGTNGDPITIIRNGQGSQSEEGWIPIVENINNSDSSVYLTSAQQIPLDASSISYVSYLNNPPTTPNKYAEKQIILNSGRLVFNSNQDHILLSSAKSINLNSQESVNIDTKKFITQADKIFLGTEELATQPLMLGSNTVDLLKNLTSAVKELANTLKTLQSAPVAPGSPATFPTLLVPMSQLVVTLESLENQLNKGVLTSKRNFTL